MSTRGDSVFEWNRRNWKIQVLPRLPDNIISASLSQLHLGPATCWNDTVLKGKMLSSLNHFCWERKSATYSSPSKQSSVVKAFNKTRLVVKLEASVFRSFWGKSTNYGVGCFLRWFQKSTHPAQSLGSASRAWRPVLCKHRDAPPSPEDYSAHLGWGNFLLHGDQTAVEALWGIKVQ